ncbi:MAG: hypothetical protein K0R29_1488, partial [Pseudobdellovibrio sp.]|nr:hypothetical protein [Pseudobdellovibrio sp.]
TASRTVTSEVVKSDRRAGAITSKTLSGLSDLDPTKRYLLNIRAYTANKSINNVTAYQYTITSGAQTLCP